jgi:hypothetical protein
MLKISALGLKHLDEIPNYTSPQIKNTHIIVSINASTAFWGIVKTTTVP